MMVGVFDVTDVHFSATLLAQSWRADGSCSCWQYSAASQHQPGRYEACWWRRVQTDG